MRISDWSSDVCSSDLANRQGAGIAHCSQSILHVGFGGERRVDARSEHEPEQRIVETAHLVLHPVERPAVFGAVRSEEHTSELQSLMRISYAVFCLKKKNKLEHTPHTTHN